MRSAGNGKLNLGSDFKPENPVWTESSLRMSRTADRSTWWTVGATLMSLDTPSRTPSLVCGGVGIYAGNRMLDDVIGHFRTGSR